MFHPSTLVDLKYVVVTILVFNAMFQLAQFSYPMLKAWELSLLVSIFGPMRPTSLPPATIAILLTLVLYLAFEFASWFNHYLCHQIPALWEFHKIHHSAEVLSPLTEWRTHPVDTWLFNNMVVVICASTHAVAEFLCGQPTGFISISNNNLILVVFWMTLSHLHHCQIWLPFTGILGRIFTSPAHHQIHHSKLPHHLGKNLGAHLALWDWVFGTLYIPARKREALDLGVDEASPIARDFSYGLITPFKTALATLRPHAPAVAATDSGGVRPQLETA